MAAPGAIDAAVIRHVARLARLALTEAQIDRAAGDLKKIVDHFSVLSAVDTEGVDPDARLLEPVARLREDEPSSSLPTAEALANAPDRAGDFFRVPHVFDAED